MKSFQNLKCITDVPVSELFGKKVLVRLDMNVPVENGIVTNGYRIESSIPTLEYLSEAGARIVAISHAGDEKQSLKPMAEYLNKFIPAKFEANIVDRGFEMSHKPGEIIVLENLRSHDGEESNDGVFVEDLAALGDIYVNEAFSTSHRSHASLVGLPKLLPSYIGLLFKKEYEELSAVFDPKHPFLFIIGGAKFSTKMPLIEKFIDEADSIFVGGALAHPLFQAKGYNIGHSLMEKDKIDVEKVLNNKKVFIPSDVTVKNGEGENRIKKINQVEGEDTIFDAGPETTKELTQKINEAEFILWNGPLGNFEAGFDAGTKEVAKAISEAKAYAIIGGGDTVASISELKIADKIGFVSTAGGAMLDFLSNETLPGIEAIANSDI